MAVRAGPFKNYYFIIIIIILQQRIVTVEITVENGEKWKNEKNPGTGTFT